jgi:hypothetical protein
VAIITPFFADTSFFNNTEGLIDPYYFNDSLLLHLDGTNGSTTFIDSSPFPKTITPGGSAQISTAQSKFGGASAYFNGASNISTVENNVDFDIGIVSASTNLTVEFWVRPDSVTGTRVFVTHALPGSGGNGIGGWGAYSEAGKCVFVISKNSNSVSPWYYYLRTDSVVFSSATWAYVAIVIASGVPKIYINGISAASTPVTSSGIYATSPIGFDTTKLNYGLRVGSSYTDNNNPSPLSYMTGYIDELRVTKGVARYTTNFIPLSRPFSEITTYPYTIDGVGIASVPFVPRDSSGVIATNTIATIGFSSPDFNAYARTETIYPVTLLISSFDNIARTESIYPVPLLIPSFDNIARTNTVTTIPFAIRNP